MDIKSLIISLYKKGVSVTAEQGRLLVKGSLSALQAEDKIALKENKEAIILFLAEQHKQQDGIKPREKGVAIPLSDAQRRLWFISQLQGPSAQYNMPLALHLKGPLDVSAFNQSWTEIIRRHEILRSNFVANEDGDAVQVVKPAYPVEIQPVTLTSEVDELSQRVQQEASRAFDLSEDQLIRIALLELNSNHHILLLTLHHIVSDGWSSGVLVTEFSALYDAFSQGNPSPLPELKIQYGDFALWQQQRMDEKQRQDLRDYWQQKLSGAPDEHALPLDFPRPAVFDASGRQYCQSLGQQRLKNLKRLAAEQGATLTMLLHAAFALLLCRWSRREDLLLAMPVSGRINKQVEPLVGFFVNTLILRTEIQDKMSFLELVQQSKETLSSGLKHQELSFDEIVDMLQPQRRLNCTPLAQIAFGVDSKGPDNIQVNGIEISGVEQEDYLLKYDLEVMASDVESDLVINWGYATSLFTEVSIARLAEAYSSLIDALLANPASPVQELNLISVAENRWLEVQQQIRRPYPQNLSIPELFAQQVAQQGSNTAVSFGERAISYVALQQQSDQVAAQLYSQGIRADDRVGIFLPRCIENIIAQLAILKIGAAYVPLDPEQPQERLQLILDDCQIMMVLTLSDCEQAVPNHNGRNLCIEALLTQTSSMNSSSRDMVQGWSLPDSSADSAAYVMFTSGSTGKPKGVVVSQQNIIRLVCEADYFQVESNDVVCHMANSAFDASTFEVWSALLNGAHLQILDKDTILQTADFGTMLAKKAISILFITTALFNQIARTNASSFSGLRALLFGGEAVDNEAVDLVLGAGKPQNLLHVYGPTENCTFSTAYQIIRPLVGPYPIGRGINGTACIVVDVNNKLQPPGAIGELLVAGDGLALGYLNRPEINAEKFIEHPLNVGSLWYRTGDLVRWNEDGQLTFIGRVDNQVKIRGFRIEPGEIEQQLKNEIGVEDACVLVLDDEQGQKQLQAWVIPDAGKDTEPFIATLKKNLAHRLPPYMLPRHIVALDSWPITANGKIDKAALPKPTSAVVAIAEEQLPQSETEQYLAALWSELLALPDHSISVQASFFELGGHSLLVTKLVNKVNARFNAQISVKQVFERPTIAAIAELIEQSDAKNAIRIPERESGALIPLSSTQRRLWFIDRLQQQNSVQYNMPVALNVSGALQVDAFEQALQQLILRHEILRTTYHEDADGKGIQQVHNEFDFTLKTVDLSTVAIKEKQQTLIKLAQNEALQAFDLSRDISIRAQLIKLDAQDFALLMTLHHIASDGWSMEVLQRDLLALYHAIVHGQSADLPELNLQYGDFASWQYARLSNHELDKQSEFWLEHLADLPKLHSLPTDHKRPLYQSSAGAVYDTEISLELVQRLNQFAGQHELTMFMLLHSVFALLIGRLSNESDVVTGTPVSGRESEQLHDLVGFFANTLVLRNDLSNNCSVREYLAASREKLIACFDNQSVPFESLVEKLASEREASYSPLFQILFSFGKATSDSIASGELSFTPIEAAKNQAKFDLSLHIAEHGQGAMLSWEYSTALFNADTVAAFNRHFLHLLSLVLAEPDSGIHSLPLVAQPEPITAQSFAADSAVEARFTGCLHQLFEQQAAHYPDNIALLWQQQEVSYQQLNNQANQLSHTLIEQGVKPGEIVALMMDRGPSLVIGLLAILKTGAAYLPIDPASPKARVAYQLSDAKAKLLVCEHTPDMELPDDCSVIALSEFASEQSAARFPNPNVQGISETNAAYVIYTSGSTGKPKGVVIEHRNVTALFNSAEPLFSFSQHDCWTLFHSFAFDFSVWEIWGALLYGARLVVVPFDVSRNTDAFSQLLVEHKVTVLSQTPSAFYQLSDSTLRQQLKLALRYVVFGGEALAPERLLPWVEHYGDRTPQLINMYGITETTVHVTFRRLCGSELMAGRSLIGKPLPHLVGFICNQELQPQPPGAPGELLIGGSGLAREYLHRAELTRQRFIENPFDIGGQRLYRSGDLVRQLENGELEYLGRIDQQTKVRGYRIELGEIEQQLLMTGQVTEAAVLVNEHHGQQQLVAYIVPQDDEGSGLVNQLQKQLKEQLPVYMLPSAFVILDTLPLTNNGKLDKTKLLSVAQRQLASEQYVAPDNETQEILTQVWQDTLEIEKVGVNDNFFAIGGDSIRVIQIVKRAKDAGVHLEVKDLFEYQTVASLAEFYEKCHRSQATQIETEQVVKRFNESYDLTEYLGPDIEDAFPVTGLQKLMLEKHGRQGPECGIYQPQSLFEVKGHRLDVTKLESVFNRLLERHPVLRTRFRRNAEYGFVQVVRKHAKLSIPVTDLSRFSKRKQRKKVAELIEDDVNCAIKLNNDCMRCQVVCFDEFHWGVLITTHHAIEDGWGFVQFLSELLTLYSGTGRLTDLPADNVFKQRVALEWQAANSEDYQTVWQELLSEHRAMPDLQALPKVNAKASSSIAASISTQRVEALRAIAKDLELPVKSLFLYAYMQALAATFHISRVTVDMVTSGRTAQLQDPLSAVGLFWNLLPVTAEVTSEPHQDLSGLQQRLLKIDSHPLFPVTEIHRLLDSEPSFAAFNFVDFHNQEQMPDSDEMEFSVSHATDRFHHAMKLAISVDRSQNTISATFDYDRRYFTEKQSVKFLKLFGQQLKEISVLPPKPSVSKTNIEQATDNKNQNKSTI